MMEVVSSAKGGRQGRTEAMSVAGGLRFSSKWSSLSPRTGQVRGLQPNRPMETTETTPRSPDANPDRLFTVAEYAEKWRYSEWTIREYCKAERIPGAEKAGAEWRIPADARILPATTAKAEKPADHWFITQRATRRRPHREDTLASPPSMSRGHRTRKAMGKPDSPKQSDDRGTV